MVKQIMRRKVLQDIANTLCQMFVGWRLGQDYEKLANLPDGTLQVNLLLGQTQHSSGIEPILWITGELAAWFRERLIVYSIPLSEIQRCSLAITYTTNRIKTDRKKIISFDFSCTSTIKTDEVEYNGVLVERHSYHQHVQFTFAPT